MKKRGMVLTDLDGTLLKNDHSIDWRNLETLQKLADIGVTRVVATGRTLYSARKIIYDAFPIDYLVFSSGSGIVDWKTGELIYKTALQSDPVRQAAQLLAGLDVDFSVHFPIPDNHRFYAFASSRPCSDFLTRMEIYRDFASYADMESINEATQLLAICMDGVGLIRSLKEHLRNVSIIRSTSPLDKKHMWVEIFPENVSKGFAAEWLAACNNLPRELTMSIGNDYNDLAMLRWTGTSYLTANAAGELRSEFNPAPSNEDCGFEYAVSDWLGTINTLPNAPY